MKSQFCTRNPELVQKEFEEKKLIEGRRFQKKTPGKFKSRIFVVKIRKSCYKKGNERHIGHS